MHAWRVASPTADRNVRRNYRRSLARFARDLIVQRPVMNTSRERFATRIAAQITRINRSPSPPVEGRLIRMVGLTLEAIGCQAAVGDRCDIVNSHGDRIEAEVVGFSGERLYLMQPATCMDLSQTAACFRRAAQVWCLSDPNCWGASLMARDSHSMAPAHCAVSRQ